MSEPCFKGDDAERNSKAFFMQKIDHPFAASLPNLPSQEGERIAAACGGALGLCNEFSRLLQLQNDVKNPSLLISHQKLIAYLSAKVPHGKFTRSGLLLKKLQP